MSKEQDRQSRVLPKEGGSMFQRTWYCADSRNPTGDTDRGIPRSSAREVEKYDTSHPVVNGPEECPFANPEGPSCGVE